jgi:hypothetical protein
VSTGVLPTRLGVYTGAGGSGTNRMQFSSSTNVGFPSTAQVYFTNSPAIKTNVAPTSTTVGVTAPDLWMAIRATDNNSVYYFPVWTNH